MSNETKLGTAPQGNEGRDAVHVAIIPICAAHKLNIGSPVTINLDGLAESCSIDKAMGVVDPFRNQAVTKGSWFWLCLYPKTITSLRHVWEHPAFPISTDPATQKSVYSGNKAESEEWVKSYVKIHCPYWDQSPDSGYGAFLDHVSEREIFYYGRDCHGLSDVEDADELFHHLSIILGIRIDASYFESFSCSC